MTVGVISPREIHYYRQAYKSGAKTFLGELKVGDRFIWDPHPGPIDGLPSFPGLWEVTTISRDGTFRLCRDASGNQESHLLSSDTLVVYVWQEKTNGSV